jgi:uncharacterized protein
MGGGQGVFMDKPIRPNTLVESTPAIVFSANEELPHPLGSYIFKWGSSSLALLMGLGSFFNHSKTPNVRFSVNRRRIAMDFFAIGAIATCAELCLDYDCDFPKVWADFPWAKRYLAHFGHRDHRDRSIVITRIGHRDRSEATLG